MHSQCTIQAASVIILGEENEAVNTEEGQKGFKKEKEKKNMVHA